MKTWGGWERSVKFTSLIAVVSSCILLANFRGRTTRFDPKRMGVSSASAAGPSGPLSAKENSPLIEAYGKLPLRFEENQGQTAQEVRYVSHGSGYELFLTPQEAVLALRSNRPLDLSPLHRAASIRALRKARQDGQVTAIRMRFEGANPTARALGIEPLPGKTDYFIGNDPRKWHTDVPSYARVKYSGIYPGVDLVFYGNQRRLEYDFVVAPGADPQAIQLNLEGARKMRINSRGDLVLKVSGGEVELRRPMVYQSANGERREITGRYVVAADHRITFAVGSYDRKEPLILDPVLNFSTYLGGSADDLGNGIAVDGSGNAFIAGQTFSTNFPAGANGAVSPAPIPTNSGASFVAEIDPTGTKLLYSTYLAGTTTSPGDTAFAIALDPSGKVYVTGTTFATNFPTKSGLTISGNATNGVAYVSKLDPAASGSASLLYSTFLGGTGGDFGNAIAADAAGNAYVVGLTDSTNFRTKNAFQSVPGSTHGTAFLSRIDTTLSGDASLIYSTYLGGNGAHFSTTTGQPFGDEALGVAADKSNIAYVIGTTTSTDSSFIITTTAYQTAPPAANTRASVFLSKIDTTKNGVGSLIYSTYLAGSGEDLGFAIALGPSNVAYLTGTTNSTDFPVPGATTGAFDPNGAASGKAFVTLVDTTKSGTASVTHSTFLGGTGGDTGFGIKADSAGNAYVAGTTASGNFAGAGTLKSLGAFQPALSNTAGNAFIAKLNPAGTALLYATYFGGSGKSTPTATTVFPDQGFGIAIDSSNPPNAYITGQTSSMDLPVFPKAPASPTAFQTSINGTSDVYVAKLTPIPTLAISPTNLNFGTQPLGVTSTPQTVTVTNNNSVTVNFTSIAITGTNSADFAKPTDTCSPSVAAAAQCTVSVTFTPSSPPKQNEMAALVFTDSDVNSPQNVSLTGSGPMPDFTLSAAPNTLTVARGAVGAPVTIMVNPTNGFSSAVALTCTGAPANSSCVLNPTSITPPTTSTLTFTAHAMLVPLPISKPAPPLNLLRLVPLFVALVLIFLLRSAERFRTRVAMASAILICITLAACSGAGPKKTAAGTYPLTITGTSGGLSHSTTVTVTVN